MKVIPLHPEEKKRIALAVEHNRTAQQQIYTQFSSKMLGVCRQYIKDLHHAEDVMISGLMKVFPQLQSVYEMEEFSADDIQNLIDQLPDGYKLVFNLYAIEGYKHQEIAELLKISEGTSKSQLSHARKLLQHRISVLKNTLNGTK